MCVTVKVIMPVAVTAVNNCRITVFILAAALEESVDLPNLKVESLAVVSYQYVVVDGLWGKQS